MTPADMIAQFLSEMGEEYSSDLALAYLNAEASALTHADAWVWREASTNANLPSTGQVATPADFGKLVSLTVPSLAVKLRRSTEGRLRAQHAGTFNVAGTPSHYYFVGEGLYSWPAPASTLVARLAYLRNQLYFASTDPEDAILMPSRDHHLIVEGALARAFTEDDDFEKAGQWRAIQAAALAQAQEDWLRRDYDANDDLIDSGTLQDIIEEVKLHPGVGQEFNETKLLSWLQELISTIVHADSYPFREKTATVAISTDGSVELPADFGKVETFTIPEGSVKLRYQRENRLKQWYPGTFTDPASCGSRYDYPECYYQTGSALFVWRRPVRELSGSLDYIADQPTLSASSSKDDILLPAKFHGWLVIGLTARALLDKGDVAGAREFSSLLKQRRADGEEELWLRQLDANERIDYDQIDQGYNYDLDEWC